MSNDYIQGSAKVQAALLLLLVLAVGLFFHLNGVIGEALIEIEALIGTDPQLAVRMAGRLLLWLVLFSGGIAVAIAIYLLVLAARVRRSCIYPPPGMPVAFRMRIRKDAEALKMARGCVLLAAVLLLQPVAGLLIWVRVTGGAW